jgi:hypothetical protein
MGRPNSAAYTTGPTAGAGPVAAWPSAGRGRVRRRVVGRVIEHPGGVEQVTGNAGRVDYGAREGRDQLDWREVTERGDPHRVEAFKEVRPFR